MSVPLPKTSMSLSHFKVGDFQLAVIAGGLGTVCWRDVEILRGVSCMLRDENWGTLCPKKIATTISADAGFPQRQLTQTFEVDGLAEVELIIKVDTAGRIELATKITAKRDFLTNRVGLVVLHPIRGVAGTKVTVLHPDHSQTETGFPALISPSQPVCNIKALSHHIDDVAVRLTFSGDVFEMEDQRNWSDASFKTYCRPLALPHPFLVHKSEVIWQKIVLQVEAIIEPITAEQPNNAELSYAQLLNPLQVPEILLAVEADWFASIKAAEVLKQLTPSGILVRVYVSETNIPASVSLVQAAQRMSDLIDLEIVLEDGDQSEILCGIAAELDAAGLSPRRVFALPIDWMRSYQPGKAPPLATLETCIAATADAFPNAQIGAGMMTNFTELNRNRPCPGLGHFVTHGNTAIVHAADDASVWQTLEALPHIFESTKAMAAGRAYRLGLVSIGMRSNPYGSGLVNNPDQQKIAMSGDDPRQTTAFAAAYAIGVAAAAGAAGVEAIALAAPVGRFGVMSDDGTDISVFPIFHAIRSLSQIAGKSAYLLQNLPQGVVGIKASDGTLIIANCSPEIAFFEVPVTIDARILDNDDPATADPVWLDTANAVTGQRFELASGCCLFAKMALQA